MQLKQQEAKLLSGGELKVVFFKGKQTNNPKYQLLKVGHLMLSFVLCESTLKIFGF